MVVGGEGMVTVCQIAIKYIYSSRLRSGKFEKHDRGGKSRLVFPEVTVKCVRVCVYVCLGRGEGSSQNIPIYNYFKSFWL